MNLINKTRKNNGSLIAELGPVLIVLLLLVGFPLINFLGLASAAMSVNFIVNNVASQVAKSLTFNDAQQTLFSRANTLNQSGFAKFSKASPSGGYMNCGLNLFVIQTSISGSNTSLTSTANQPWTLNQIDPSHYIYQYNIVGTYNIKPFISLSNIPLISTIPGLGSPWSYTVKSKIAVEHPIGLDNGTNYVVNNGIAPLAATTMVMTQSGMGLGLPPPLPMTNPFFKNP